jgi:flagellar hook-associated protein 2
MPGLQLSGLVSGFDWKSVVDQLIAISRVPQNQMRTTRSENVGKLSILSSLRTRIDSLNTAVKALSQDSLFGRRSATLDDDDSTWSVSASSNATLGEHTFNVTQLATKTVRAGAGSRSSSLNDSNDVSELVLSDLRLGLGISEGVFTINGASVEVEETDTLQDVFDKIATATSGAVTATYNASTDVVSLAGTGTITLGASADTSNFLYAFKLYNNDASTITSASALGALRLNEALADSGLTTAITAVDSEGDGSFEINGTTIAYNVNDDTLQEIINRVNESDAKVTLSYDANDDSFTLTNQNTGDTGLVVSESAGGLLSALGLGSAATVTRGDNAEFSVNGGATIVTSSNVLDASVHGLTGITVTARSVDSQTVTVAADTKAIKEGIQSFISRYNEVQSLIKDQTKVTVGADGKVTAARFANNRELTAIASQLRSYVFDSVSDLSGTISRLESIGIDFDGASSDLAIRDASKLDDALENNLEDVTTLFTSSTDGLSTKLKTYIQNVTINGGIIDTQEDTLEKRNASLDNQIAALERHLEAERTRLEAGFIRMEEAQQQINTQLSALQRALGL